MTIDHQTTALEGDIGRLARRLIHLYYAVLDCGEAVLPSLSDLELTAVRAMLLEMWEPSRLMQVGNLLLFIDDEVNRRNGVTLPSPEKIGEASENSQCRSGELESPDGRYLAKSVAKADTSDVSREK